MGGLHHAPDDGATQAPATVTAHGVRSARGVEERAHGSAGTGAARHDVRADAGDAGAQVEAGAVDGPVEKE